jgi:imidazolonepropionase-like amidohydrolase
VLKRFFILALAVTAVAATTSVRAQQTPAVIAIRAARMFDGKSDTTIADAVVVVQGNRITAAGARLAIPAGAQVARRRDDPARLH